MRLQLMGTAIAIALSSALVATEATAKRGKGEEATGDEQAAVAEGEKGGEKSSDARPAAPRYGGGPSATPMGKTFGIGLQLGVPSALVAKLKLERNTALIFGIGGGWSWGMGSGLELSVGYVIHPSALGNYEAGSLSWYVGGAADLVLRSHSYANTWAVFPIYGASTPFGLGGHIPLGLDFQLRALPLSLFGELTPGIDLFPAIGPRLGLALGARFFF